MKRIVGLLAIFSVFYIACSQGVLAAQERSIPGGVWMFYYQLPNNHGVPENFYGTPGKMLERIRSAHIDVLGLDYYNGGKPCRSIGETEKLGPYLAKNGVKIFLWGGMYGTDPYGQTRALINGLRKPWVSGIVLDAEDACELDRRVPGNESKLDDLNMSLSWLVATRNSNLALKGKFIGFTSFAHPNMHPTFPWGMFIRNCDFFMPQDYWSTMKEAPIKEVAIVTQEWKEKCQEIGNTVPIIPVGQTYAPSLDKVENTLGNGEITQFAELTKCYPAIGLYVWPPENQQGMWTEIYGIHTIRAGVQNMPPTIDSTNGLTIASVKKSVVTEWNFCWEALQKVHMLTAFILLVFSLVWVCVLEGRRDRLTFALIAVVVAWYWPYVLLCYLSVAVLSLILCGAIGHLLSHNSFWRRSLWGFVTTGKILTFLVKLMLRVETAPRKVEQSA